MAQQTLVGTLEHITYQNPENGFLVGRFLCDDLKLPIAIRGTLLNVRPGETLRLHGDWEEHPQYGRQFKVLSYELSQPTTLEGMERYLAAMVEGIGPTIARRIVKTFGPRTFEIIDTQPNLLLEVPRFPARLLEPLQAAWQEHRGVRDALVYLHGLGISATFADRIFQAYGIATVQTVKSNPYRLAMDIKGIGFRTADGIARKLGIAPDSPERADAGILHVMDEIGLEGHTGLPRDELAGRGAELLEIAPDLADAAIGRVLSDGLLKALERGAGEPPLLSRPRMHRAETHIAAHLARLLAAGALTRIPHAAATLAAMEKATGVYLAAEQREAVLAAVDSKALIVTGGPGTGKTTIVRFILSLVEGVIPTIALAAPTGKAAKRLAEATGKPASTIHRLLEAGPRGFERDAERPIEAELAVVDESSMIDTLLMAALLSALPDTARLVLVGDVDQLPSVGPGRVLGDLIDSGMIPVVRLEKVFRQSDVSLITAHAHSIRRGDLPALRRQAGEELVDFYFMAEPEPERIVEKIVSLVTGRIPQRFGLNPRQDVQVMTPMHRGLTGAVNLNRVLQDALNPSGQEIVHGETRYRVGDRVMQTRNDYEKQVFNGDMGTITRYDPASGRLEIEFDERRVDYERKDLENVSLGYAITVHKAQGSEYPAIVLPLTTHHAIMLQRNLLYTALTRARRLAVIVGTEAAVGMAVRNAKPIVRHTGLLGRLRAGAAPAPAVGSAAAGAPGSK
jgi:exodeoxyribonuclease V alpha subunit